MSWRASTVGMPRPRSGATRSAGRVLGIVLLAVAAAGCWHTRPDSAQELGFAAGEERTIEGVVVENNVDVCMFPEEHREPCIPASPGRLLVDVDGVVVSVMYHRGEGDECDNAAAIRQGEQTRVGTRVEAFALVRGSDRLFLDTCPSPDYHITALD